MTRWPHNMILKPILNHQGVMNYVQNKFYAPNILLCSMYLIIGRLFQLWVSDCQNTWLMRTLSFPMLNRSYYLTDLETSWIGENSNWITFLGLQNLSSMPATRWDLGYEGRREMLQGAGIDNGQFTFIHLLPICHYPCSLIFKPPENSMTLEGEECKLVT